VMRKSFMLLLPLLTIGCGSAPTGRDCTISYREATGGLASSYGKIVEVSDDWVKLENSFSNPKVKTTVWVPRSNIASVSCNEVTEVNP